MATIRIPLDHYSHGRDTIEIHPDEAGAGTVRLDLSDLTAETDAEKGQYETGADLLPDEARAIAAALIHAAEAAERRW